MTVRASNNDRLARRLWNLAHRAGHGDLDEREASALHAYLDHYQATVREWRAGTNPKPS